MNVARLQERFGDELTALELVLRSIRANLASWESLDATKQKVVVEIAWKALDIVLEDK